MNCVHLEVELKVNIYNIMGNQEDILINQKPVETPEERISRVADAMIELESERFTKENLSAEEIEEKLKLKRFVSRSTVYEKEARELARERKMHVVHKEEREDKMVA